MLRAVALGVPLVSSHEHFPTAPAVKPVAELLASFDAPCSRNYVPAPVLPSMAQEYDDERDDGSEVRPMTRDQIWAALSARRP